MADIKKVIEVEVISNTGDVQKLSGSLEDVKKQVADISKAANNSVKFKMDGVEKTADEIANLSAQTDKAAESTKQLGNETKTLKQQYKEAVAALSEFEQGTEGYNIAAQRAGALKDQLEENARAINANKSGADALIGGLQGAAGAFAAVEGAAALFGKQNEDVQKALLKVQAALALVNGIEAFKDSIPNFTKIGQLVQGLPAKLGAAAAAIFGFGKAEKLAAAETTALGAAAATTAVEEQALGVSGAAAGAEIEAGMAGATVATNALKATIISTGIGALIVGLGAAAAYFASSYESSSDKAQRKSKETAEILSEEGKQYGEYIKAIETEIKRLEDLGFDPSKQYEKLQEENSKAITNLKKQADEAYKEYQRLFDEYNKETNEKDKAAKKLAAEQQFTVHQQLYNDQKAYEAKRYAISFAGGQAQIDAVTKEIKKKIALREAEGKSSIDLQIELNKKIQEINDKQIDKNYKLEEETEQKLQELRIKQAEERKKKYQDNLNANKSFVSAKLALDLATIENEKAAALSTAKNDEEKLNIEKDAYKKSKEARLQAIKDQLDLDLKLAQSQGKTAKEIETIKKNSAAATKAIETEQINNTVANTEKEFKIRMDGLSEEARILQEKVKLEGASFEDRIKLQEKQNEIELANLIKQGKDTTETIKRQSDELIKLRRELKQKELQDAQGLGNLQQAIDDSNAIINLKRNEGEKLGAFIKRRNDLEKKLTKARLEDTSNDLKAQLDQEIEVDGKKVKVLKEGSKERLEIEKQLAENKKTIKDQEVEDDAKTEQQKLDNRKMAIEKTMELLQGLADIANSILEAQTKKVEDEYAKQRKAKEDENARELSNIELTDSQKEELQRQHDIELQKLEEEKAAKLKEVQKKQADISFAITLAQIAAKTALAVMSVTAEAALAAPLLIPGIIALGAVEIGAATAQRAAVQGLARGGMVYGPGTETSDSIPAMLSNGEAVINAKAVKRFAPLLSAINQSTGGAPIRPHFAAGGIVTANPGEVAISNIQDIAAVTGQSAVRAYIIESDVASASVKNARITRQSRIK